MTKSPDMNAQFAKASEEYDGMFHTVGSSYSRTFTGFDTNVSVRSEYNRADYEYFRRSEQRPESEEKEIELSMKAYKGVAVVRSVIDMMADFTVQGIRIYHRDNRIQNFLDEWAHFVDFKGTSERIANMLYRSANAPVKITYGKIPVSVENRWKTANAEEVKIENIKSEKRSIPLRYNILNPLSIAVIGGDLAAFIGKPVYGLKVSNALATKIKALSSHTSTEERAQEFLNYIPQSMSERLINGTRIIPFEDDKFKMLFYKKDDWRTFACPFLCSLFEPLFMLEKMHLADISALDGAISQIRLWRLGDIANKIVPTSVAITKLRNILANVGNGTLDLVWGPELDFKESNSQVHNYLKSEKYQQVMAEIYAGLGVPPSLTAAGGSGQTGFTNNYISMKTLIERLNYGRDILQRFWNEQLKIIQKAFGWRFPPTIDFDFKILGDDASEKALILDMWDRNIIPTETIQQIFGRDPKIETIKLRKEKQQRDTHKVDPKAGPFHNAMTDHELRKILLQSGGVAPSELGIELKPKKSGEPIVAKRVADAQPKPATTGFGGKPAAKKKTRTPGGRPMNAKDSKKRKKKQVKIRTTAELGSFLNLREWANTAQAKVNEILAPGILEQFKHDNLRQLTQAEVEQFETLKVRILSNLEPYQDIDLKNVYSMLVRDLNVDGDFIKSYQTLAFIFEQKNNRKPNLTETREIQATAYAVLNEEEEDEYL